MTLPPVIHVTAIRNAVTPAGEWTATARAASTPYVPAAALAEAEARIKELEDALRPFAESGLAVTMGGSLNSTHWRNARAALAENGS